MLPIHVRILDAETRQPLAVRLRITDGAGRVCVPLGRPAVFRTGLGEDVGGQVRLGDGDWYHVDGGAELVVPPGRAHVLAWHGPEYRLLDEELEVKPGQLAIRLQMKRWTNERAQGWYSGDVAAFEIDPFSALLEAAAEDLAVVNVLAREQDVGDGATRATNGLAFSGTEPALTRPGYQVAVGTMNSHRVLGSLALLGCHRPVYPLRFGGPDGALTWSLMDWCDQAHRKADGLVIWPDGEPAVHPGELIAAALTGKIDAFEVREPTSPERWGLYYDLLNAGARLALVGGGGKASNTTALGQMRTYAEIREIEPLTYPAWLAAVRTGRTYATTHPILKVKIDQLSSGDVVEVSAGATVKVFAEANSAVPFEVLEVIHDGQIVQTWTPNDDRFFKGQVQIPQPDLSPEQTLKPREYAFGGWITVHLPVQRTGWIAARCRVGERIVAHTTPIYLRVAGGEPAVLSPMLQSRLEETRRWAETAPGEDRFRHQLLANLSAAERPPERQA